MWGYVCTCMCACGKGDHWLSLLAGVNFTQHTTNIGLSVYNPAIVVASHWQLLLLWPHMGRFHYDDHYRKN